MSILNITNLTDNPTLWINNKFEDAFNKLEEELDITIDETEKQ